MNGSAVAFRRAISSIKTHLLSKQVLNNSSPLNRVRCFSVAQRRNMKLVQFSYKEQPGVIRAGYVDGNGVVDINKADPSLPVLLVDILKKDGLQKVLGLPSKKPSSVPLSNVRLEAPISGQDKVLCVGLNYMDHCKEQDIKPPEVPMIFSKFSSAVVGPCDSVKLRTEVTDSVDWEVELVIVIGKEACFVQAKDAFNYILGYTIAQDISARDWQKQKNGGQVLLGKTMDTFCPIGPWIVTSDDIPDPEKLNISCEVNGVLKQSSNTCQLIHKIPTIIERLSSVMTLYPGDIILTGTPGGVGMHRKPPEFLKPGDFIKSTIEKIGVLETNVVKFERKN